MGLGTITGRLFLVLTTTGRKSGQPRQTAIEYHRWRGRTYVVSAWGDKADWYKNIQADPRVTIQTAHGTESMIARRVTSEEELLQAFEMLEQSPTMRQWLRVLGVELDAEEFLQQSDRFFLITFDRTAELTPAPPGTDLWWIWLLLGAGILLLRLRTRPR